MVLMRSWTSKTKRTFYLIYAEELVLGLYVINFFTLCTGYEVSCIFFLSVVETACLKCMRALSFSANGQKNNACLSLTSLILDKT